MILWEQQTYFLADLYSLVPGFAANLVTVVLAWMIFAKKIKL